MKVYIETEEGRREADFDVKKLIVVGFAGKDVEKTMEHIRELEAEGIKCPSEVPVVYRCAKNLLTEAETIEVVAGDTSGEVEYLIFSDGGRYYIGLGSDHTDRSLEGTSIHKSKQVCAKPYANTFWLYDEIVGHFESIKLISSQIVDGERIEYQEGVTGDLLPLQTIIEKIEREESMEGALIYTGTVPLKNGFKFGERFSCALIDETLGRKIELSYGIETIREH